jgi:tripartite-type tricarboxylate transporter receptor subunit TctC
MTQLRLVAASVIVVFAAIGGIPGRAAARAPAEPYPSQTVTIVVPFLAGGAVGVMGRIIAAKLQEYWKHPVVVENRPGGYPKFYSGVWYSLLAPANTPASLVDKIRTDMLRAVHDSEARLKPLAVELVGTTPADAKRILAEETVSWSAVIRSVGLSAE